MMSARLAAILSLNGVLLALWPGLPCHAAELRVGFGVADITPTPGMEIPGFLERKVGTRVTDPLYVEAAAFDSGNQRILIMGIDSLMINESTVKSARERIQSETSIPAEHILIGASHTHTGGPIRPSLTGQVDEKYMKLVLDGLAEAGSKAWKTREPAEIAIASGDAPGLGFNRRFLMRDGREITHPGKPGAKHHGEIVKAAGPVDSSVGVLAVRAPTGRCAARWSISPVTTPS